ncbi:serine hydrolase [Bacillus sp. FJAT-49736]|uniref:serine hydrolase n=1 Tax=Bacillus sp. FJAT-49736 TaxID=2833582 RepID=UPI001BCA1A78|nr:serine hydrolase [Bacillus sp. FJAT-49736]MBS4172924.1 serine hydrolase [Bacillus sp. FJAT-49736]
MRKVILPFMIVLIGIMAYLNFNLDSFSKKNENLVLSNGKAEQVGANQETLSGIDSIVNKAINDKVTPGAVVLITKDGKIIKETAYGDAEKYDRGKILSPPQKMTVNTMFDLASITKVMATTQGIMKLVEEGKISVKDKVVKYFPEFGKYGKSKITLEDLLTHSSGLPGWEPAYLYVNNSSQMLKYINNMKLAYKTGTDRVYSDFNFMVLGYIIEKVTHTSLDNYVKSTIYQPLGVDRTMFNPKQKGMKDIAATSWGNPYDYKETKALGAKQYTKWRAYTFVGEVEDGNSYFANDGVAGHAGLFSTARDLAVMGQILINGGKYGKKDIFEEKTITQFTTEHRFGQGLGWERNQPFMGKLHSKNAFGHNGSTGTQIIIDPDNNVQIIVLTNKLNNGLPKNGTYPSTTAFSANIADIVYQSIE